MTGAIPECISERANAAWARLDKAIIISSEASWRFSTHAVAYGLAANDVVVTIHCGSRGLGHQIGSEFLRGQRGGSHVHRVPRSRTCVRADRVRDRQPLSRRNARGHQLRACKSRDPQPRLRPITVPSRTFMGASLCRVAHSRASWFRRDPSSAVVRAVCDQAPESGSSRRPTARWRVRADRHRAQRRRAICRRTRIVGQLELAHPVRLQTMGAPDALNRTHAEPSRLRH